MSAENRLRAHVQNGLSKIKSPKLNTHEAFLCLAQSILVTRAQPHIPEICLSTLLVNHKNKLVIVDTTAGPAWYIVGQ